MSYDEKIISLFQLENLIALFIFGVIIIIGIIINHFINKIERRDEKSKM